MGGSKSAADASTEADASTHTVADAAANAFPDSNGHVRPAPRELGRRPGAAWQAPVRCKGSSRTDARARTDLLRCIAYALSYAQARLHGNNAPAYQGANTSTNPVGHHPRRADGSNSGCTAASRYASRASKASSTAVPRIPVLTHACFSRLPCSFAPSPPALPAVDSSVVLEGIDLASFDRRRAIFLASLALALAIPARTIHIHEVALGAYGGVEIKFKIVVADVTRARNIARRMALHNFSRGLSSAIHIPSHNILAGGATVVSNLRANSFAAEASFLSKQSTETQPQPAPTQPPPNDMAIVLGSPLLAGLGFLVVTLFGLLVAQIMEQQQQLRGTTPLDSDV